MESVLDEVVVYAAGALCRRRASGEVPPDGVVRLTGLPAGLDPSSLRGRVTAGGWRVTEARVEYATELRAPEQTSELLRALLRAREEADAVRSRIDRHEARIAELTALRPVAPPRRRDDPPHRRTPAESWLALADFTEERLTALHEAVARLREEHALAEHAVTDADQRLRRADSAASTGPVTPTATALLTLTPTAPDQPAGPVGLTLEYGIPGARWVPSYRLSHRQGESTGRLVLRASVVQRTGEDWTGVRLGLSTADLQRRTDLPRLRSLRIGRRQSAPPPSGWRDVPPGLSDLFTAYESAGPRPSTARTLSSPVAVAASTPRRAARGGTRAPAAEESTGFLTAGGAPPAPLPSAPSGPARSVARPTYGGSPPPAPAAPAAPAAFAAPPPPGAPAPQAAPPPPPEPEGAPHPDARWLDYRALTLQGPGGRHRGQLVPAPPAAPASAPAVTTTLPRYGVPPRISAGSFDQRYDTAAPVDVPSDGTWHTVTVGEVPVGLATEHVCVPSVEQTVYATLLLANATDHALLAGPVEVTVDGDFLLTAALPTLAPGATRRLGLGVAEGVRVARRTELRESTTGALSKTTVLDHRVHVELVNRLAHPVTVEVRERVPVAGEPDIKVQERPGWTAPDGPSEEYPPSTRLRRVELPAHGRAELDGGYEIRIPAGKTLLGGDRRN
ncbi:DUF4139 domain-containing protein [Kitasatospora sp. NPDC051853]|uniref:DUF4139 domain-containing protein n=1 Tax=Kitasatospora sp. NPDC051853 TaxID=3364058 RepID=UPI0037A7EFEE